MNRASSTRRVLMLAPEPVLQPRGTPISVFHRLRALSALGYAVDLVTYPFGEPIEIPDVRVMRVWRPWGLRRIKIGPSAPKLLLDLCLAVVALGCLLRRRYDAVHSHEEMVFVGAAYARLFRIPHLYDMHSSLPQQLRNWRQGYAGAVAALADRMERWAIRQSDVVITICQALADQVTAVDPAKPQVMIENAATLDGSSDEARRAIRSRHGANGAPLVVYTGNFEPYQGVELLLESFSRAHRRRPETRLLLVGGTPEDVARWRDRDAARALGEAVQFVGAVPPDAVSAYLDAADVLVSPRIAGTNTPLKIYAYLKAGKPVLATDLPTHTQLLTPQIARLTAPEPSAFGAALLGLLTDRQEAEALGRRARSFAQERLSGEAYTARVAEAYRLLLQGAA